MTSPIRLTAGALLPHIPEAKAASHVHQLVNGLLSFRVAVLQGFADIQNVDDWVEFWHENQTNCSLSEFLGLNKQEYAVWMREPGELSAMFYGQVDGK